MKLSCLFGHKWNGCTCARCGEVRDEGHEFKQFSSNGALCVASCKCGKSQTQKHDLRPVPDKCFDVCARCGYEAVNNPHHAFERIPGQCGWKCKVCGKVKPFDLSEHSWQRVEGKCAEKCAVCGMERKLEHQWRRVEGKCAKVCERCGMEEALEHQWERVEGTDQERCAVCGKVRMIPGIAAYRKDPDAFVEDCVEKLLAIFPTTPLNYEGHKSFDAAHREEVRRIGEQLNDLGGMRAMRRVGEAFARRRPIHARKLETTWDGIGNWMA